MQRLAFLCAASAYGTLANPLVQSRQVSYDGVGVFRVPVGDDVSKVAQLVEKLELDTWKSYLRPGAYADVVVPPEKLQAFQEEVAGVDGVVTMHENLAASIAAEQEPAVDILSGPSLAAINTTWFSAYHSYADHLSYLAGLQASFPDNSEIVTSGTSVQGNTITGIHIYGSSGKAVNPAVVLHGTVHAREWITTMVGPNTAHSPFLCHRQKLIPEIQVVEYFAESLLSNYSTDAETTSFVDKYDFYIFPVVNPDGEF